MEIDAINKKLTKTLKQFVKNKKYKEVHRTFEKAKIEYGVEPNIFHYNTKLLAYTQQNQTMNAERLLKEMETKGITPNAYSYSILIDMYANLGLLEELTRTYQKMLEKGFRPEITTYTSIIKAYSRTNNMDKAEEIISGLKNSNFELDNVTFNILLTGYVQNGDLKKAEEVIERMKEENVKPTVVSYTTLLQGFANSGNMKEANRIFALMKENDIHPNSVTNYIMLQGYVKTNQFDEAFEFLKVETQGDHKRSYYFLEVIGQLMRGFYEKKKMDKLNELVEYLSANNAHPNITSFNLLIEGYLLLGKYEKMVELLNTMAMKVTANCKTWNLVIDALLDKNTPEETMSILENVTEHILSVLDFNYIIKNLCEKKDFDKIGKCLRLMDLMSIQPNGLTVNFILWGLLESKRMDEVLIFVEKIKRVTKLNLANYNLLIDKLSRNNYEKELFKLFEEMKANGLTPNTNTYSPIIIFLYKKRRWGTILQYVQEMREQNIPFNSDIEDIERRTRYKIKKMEEKLKIKFGQ